MDPSYQTQNRGKLFGSFVARLELIEVIAAELVDTLDEQVLISEVSLPISDLVDDSSCLIWAVEDCVLVSTC